MRFLFNLSLAFRAIRNNKLRSILTIAIIGIGITALVGILTAIEVMKASVYTSFSSMGANSFQITSDIIKQKRGKGHLNISITEGKNIRYEEAVAFKERYKFPSVIGLSMSAGGIATVRHGSLKTNPNIAIMGIDENYLRIADTKLDAGRSFSPYELQNGSYTCILGNGIASKLFKRKPANAVGEVVSVGDVKYRVIGITEAKGGSMIMNADNTVLVPLTNGRIVYGGDQKFVINVMVDDVSQRAIAAEEAEGLFRVIRKIPVGKTNDFTVSQNDSLAEMLYESISVISWAAVIIGMITLLGSVIGLMNIMLVSVAERTREIGVNKALGAKSSVIKQQFLTESVLISLFGGLVGIVLGILIGNLIGLALHTGFIIPWMWILVGVSLCALVGIVSGIYPAIKASKLDPIVALRYE